MKVKAEGRSRMITKVMIGLIILIRQVENSSKHKKTHEYHSQAEYSAVISRERVRNPECDVFEESIRDESCM